MKVSRLEEVHVEFVSCGPDFAIAADNQGRVFGWGRNERGQVINIS